jgi:hypothetical protein
MLYEISPGNEFGTAAPLLYQHNTVRLFNFDSVKSESLLPCAFPLFKGV